MYKTQKLQFLFTKLFTMVVNSLPKTVTRQRRDCNLNPGPSAPESSTLTTPLPEGDIFWIKNVISKK